MRKSLYILHIYVIYNLLWLWFEIKLFCLINPFYFKYRETSDRPSKTNSALLFYGSTELEQNHNLAKMIQSNYEAALKKNVITVHNYYICSANKCNSISKEDQTEIMKHKNFQHKWLFNPDLSRCLDTDIWSLCYVNNEGMFCQLDNGMHPQSKLTVWNKEPKVRYRPKTIRGHFIKAEGVKDTMHTISAEKEHLKQSPFFVKEHQKKERMFNASYKKVFMSLYWLCKEEITVSKAVSIFDLHEMLGVSDIALFTTRSLATIRNMIIVFSDIIKEELVKKSKVKVMHV